MTNPGDGVFIPIELDTTKAVEQFDQFKDSVKQADLRPNQAIEDFFDDSGAAAAKAAKEVAEYRKQLQIANQTAKNMAAKSLMGSLSAPAKFQMNMAAMGGAGYKSFAPQPKQRAYSNEYGRQVGAFEDHKKSAYENQFQNRFLASEIADGSYKKQVKSTLDAESAAKRLQFRQNELLKQARLIERQARYGNFGGRLAHLYGENEKRIRGGLGATGQMAGRGAGMAGIGAAGLVASGFSGTIEGERFARELRVLSLELAAAFKPAIDAVTDLTKRARKGLQGLDQQGQDRMMIGAGAAAGAYAGSRGGPIGALLGALVGAAVAKSQTPDKLKESRFESIREGNYSDEMVTKNADLLKMNDSERLAEIDRRRAALLDQAKKNRESLRMYEGTKDEERAKKAYVDAQVNIKDEANALDEMKKRTKEGKSLQDMQDIANPNRRQLMLTEGTGFAGAGSTFFALQEDLARTSAAALDKANEQRQEMLDILRDQQK